MIDIPLTQTLDVRSNIVDINTNATIPPVTAAIPTDIFIGITTTATDKGTKETNTNMNTVKLKETNKTKEILILNGQRLYGFIEKIDEKRKQDDLIRKSPIQTVLKSCVKNNENDHKNDNDSSSENGKKIYKKKINRSTDMDEIICNNYDDIDTNNLDLDTNSISTSTTLKENENFNTNNITSKNVNTTSISTSKQSTSLSPLFSSSTSSPITIIERKRKNITEYFPCKKNQKRSNENNENNASNANNENINNANECVREEKSKIQKKGRSNHMEKDEEKIKEKIKDKIKEKIKEKMKEEERRGRDSSESSTDSDNNDTETENTNSGVNSTMKNTFLDNLLVHSNYSIIKNDVIEKSDCIVNYCHNDNGCNMTMSKCNTYNNDNNNNDDGIINDDKNSNNDDSNNNNNNDNKNDNKDNNSNIKNNDNTTTTTNNIHCNDNNDNIEKFKTKYINIFYTEIKGIINISNRVKQKNKNVLIKRITPTFLAPLSKKEKYIEMLMYERTFQPF